MRTAKDFLIDNENVTETLSLINKRDVEWIEYLVEKAMPFITQAQKDKIIEDFIERALK